MERMEKKGKKKDVSDFAATKKKIGPRDKSDFAKGFVPKKKRVRGPKVSVPGSMRGGPPQRVAPTKKKDVSDFAATKKKIGPRDKSDFAATKKKIGPRDKSDFAVNTKPKAKTSSPKTFSEAFSQARKKQGAGGTFTYKGKKYSTNRADDKKKKKKIDFSKIVSAAKKSRGKKATT